mgnify:FL=1|jgi:hypothetical protein
MLQTSDFKKISVKDIRKIIKELDLKKKKKELKGYSYRKKKDLIDMLLDMDIPMSVLDKYRKVKGAKGANAKAKGANAKAPVKKNIVMEVKDMPRNENMFEIMEVEGGQVKKVGEYKEREDAMNSFNEMVKMNKKVYLIKGNQVLRSYQKPNIRMMGNGRFKVHLMYKGKKTVVADTKAEHMALERIGYKHKAGDNPGHSKKNSPKAKKKAQMSKMESSYGY